MQSETLQQQVLIISSKDYKEYDSLIRVIDDRDITSTFVAKGVLKPTSKNASALTVCTLSKITYMQKGSMPLILTASIVDYYRLIKEDLHRMAVAALCLEITDAMLMNQTKIDGIYSWITSVLSSLKTEDPMLVACWYVLKMADEFGVGFYVDGCVICSNTSISSIGISEGGFMCADCATSHKSDVLGVDDYRLFRCLVKADVTQMSKCLTVKTPTMEHLRLIMEFFMEFTSIYPKSWVFLKNL